ncbi:hypothetical protein GCM10009827_050740 [Dactylosporangium maewongense]|uniref:Uncharacterized protein n=1 Tax=Dactylosporangium maewongense TaxID=634393 RepID=A0ABP4LMP8_9ACTN
MSLIVGRRPIRSILAAPTLTTHDPVKLVYPGVHKVFRIMRWPRRPATGCGAHAQSGRAERWLCERSEHWGSGVRIPRRAPPRQRWGGELQRS